MTKIYRNIAFWTVGVLFVVLAIGLPRTWRQDNPNIDPVIRSMLRSEAQVSFDAPMLELLGATVIRLDSYDPKTTVAKAGAYSWFGIKVATITLEKCQYWRTGKITTPYFGCNGGGSVSFIPGV